ncbi:MAG TPA: HAD family hydrolase [Candidatus Acetothermia bacterium]|nr:HAD family hydrolase [Candidatus Acetothermia bacterium]
MRELIGFDMDGVILDSDRPDDTWFRDSFVRTLQDFGVEPTEENIRELYISSMRDNFVAVCERLGIDDPHILWKRRDENYIAYKLAALEREEIQLFPDTAVLFRLGERYPLGLVSNSPQAVVDMVIEHFSLQHVFKVWFGRGDTLPSLQFAKPSPQMLLEMMGRLHATRGYYVGDRPEDIVAARAAGLTPISISRDGNDGDIRSLEELPELIAQTRATVIGNE